jgi:hypothetical protein
LATDIEKTLGIKATLIEDHGGIFEVRVNDEIIYSNHRECGQQFIPADIIKDIKEILGSKQLIENNSTCKCEGG